MASTKKFTFVSYDGKWPNLCRGVLVLKDENNEIYTFGEVYAPHPDLKKYPSFWSSGGCIRKGEDWDMWAEKGHWEFDSNDTFINENKDELMRVFSENVEQGCCGGCI